MSNDINRSRRRFPPTSGPHRHASCADFMRVCETMSHRCCAHDEPMMRGELAGPRRSVRAIRRSGTAAALVVGYRFVTSGLPKPLRASDAQDRLHLDQPIKAIEIERGYAPLRFVRDLRQRAIKRLFTSPTVHRNSLLMLRAERPDSRSCRMKSSRASSALGESVIAYLAWLAVPGPRL